MNWGEGGSTELDAGLELPGEGVGVELQPQPQAIPTLHPSPPFSSQIVARCSTIAGF